MRSTATEERQRAGWVLTIIVATTSLTGISVSIMVIAFPAIREAFPSASASQLSWINNLFTIVTAATLIPCGALADRVGRKRMLLIGVSLFFLGSLISAVAPSPEWIMVGRTVLSLGAAAFGPAGTALLISAYPPEKLGSAIGVWALTSGVSSALGPSLGGILVDHGGWQWAFWLNLPLCVFVLALAPFTLRESVRDIDRQLPDVLSVFLVIATTSAFTLGIVQRKTLAGWGWLGEKTWACVVVSALFAAWFVARSKRLTNPLVPLDIFRARTVRVGVCGLIITGVAFYAVYWAFVQHTVNQWNWSIARAGVITAPTAFTSGLAAIATSRAAARFGQRPFIIIGSIGVVLSCVYLWFAMGSQESVAGVLIGGIGLGVASGLIAPAFIATTLSGVRSEEHSVGSALNFMAQRTSATLGTALAITFVAGATGSGALHQAVTVSALAAAIGVPLGLLLKPR